MSRRFLTSLAATTAIVLLAGSAGASAAPLDGSASKVVVATASDRAAEGPLAELRRQVQSIVDEAKSSGLVGTAVDAAKNEITLYWHGSLPASAAQLRAAPPTGSQLTIVSVPYALTSLQAEARRLAVVHRTGSTPVSRVGALPDFSGLSVSVLPGVDLEKARRSITSSVKLAFTTAPTAVPAVGRWDDSTPFWGGGLIASATSLCSTAFTIRDRFTTVLGMMTAYHCGMNTNWTTGTGARAYGRTTEGNEGYDVAMITGQSYDPVIFNGPPDSSRGETVGNLYAPAIGDYVCYGGALSGEVCRNRVTATMEFINFPDGTTIGPGFWTTQLDGLGAAGNGDSGGPTYVRGHTGIEASGVISAIDLTYETTCLGYQAQGRQCSSQAFTVGLNFPFEDLGWSLETRRS